MSSPEQPDDHLPELLPLLPEEPNGEPEAGLVIGEENLAIAALTAPDREPASAEESRSFIGAFRERRAEKLRHKARMAAIDRKLVVEAYGGERSNTLGLGGQASRLVQNAAAGRAHSRGELTAEEYREARHQNAAAPPRATENPEQRRTRRKLERIHEKVGLPIPPIQDTVKPLKTDAQRRRAMERVAAVPEAPGASTQRGEIRKGRLDYPKIPGYQYAQDLDAINPAYYSLFEDDFVEDIARSITQKISENLKAGKAYRDAKLDAQNEVIASKVDSDTPEDIKEHLLIAQLVAANLIDKPNKTGKSSRPRR